MPQFDPLNFAPQFVWLVIVFAILYFGIVKPTLPKLTRVIDAREGKVTGDIDAAGRAKAEADRIAADYDASVAAAHERSRTRVEAARQAAASSLGARLQQSKVELDARIDAAEQSIDAARRRAMGEIEQVAADAAADIVERLTGARPDADMAAGAARAALG